jgi:hypothetical protein
MARQADHLFRGGEAPWVGLAGLSRRRELAAAELGNRQSQQEPHGVMPRRLFYAADQVKASESKLEHSNAKLAAVRARNPSAAKS